VFSAFRAFVICILEDDRATCLRTMARLVKIKSRKHERRKTRKKDNPATNPKKTFETSVPLAIFCLFFRVFGLSCFRDLYFGGRSRDVPVV